MKKGAVKNYVLCCGRSKWDGWPMANADFRGTPTYFAVFKMMI